MGFYDEMQSILNSQKTLTTNGAIAYRTAGNALLDFNFAITALRNASEEKIVNEFAKVFYENNLIAVKYLFYVGDVRGGLGERKIFRTCMNWLAETKHNIAIELLKLIPEYTRWDNLVRLVSNDDVSNDVVAIVKNQLELDIKNMKENKPISLLAKWMPSANTSSKETKNLANIMIKKLGVTPREYRKMLSALRKYLEIVEIKMSQKEWADINYEAVPSKANLRYNKAFLRNDEERRREYLAALSKGEAKINASALQPHEIVYKYRLDRFNETYEGLWNALPNLSVENTLVIRDGSGSMTWTRCGMARPLEVATALAIYMAEHNNGAWKDKFVTFSAYPKVIDLSGCKTLKDKIDKTYREDDCSNTNIYATMRLILDTAIKGNMTQKDMPATIVICSDMQFDGRSHRFDKSLFDDIAEQFAEHGYKMPKICFWNLSGTQDRTVPMQQNELGLVLCSGFSVQILKMFMSGETDPLKCLLEQVNSERYAPVEEAINGIF